MTAQWEWGKVGRGLSKGEEKNGGEEFKVRPKMTESIGAAVKTVTWSLLELRYWGEWQFLIKKVADYHVRNNTICLRPGVEDESILFVENSNLEICIFSWTSVVCFWWETCDN